MSLRPKEEQAQIDADKKNQPVEPVEETKEEEAQPEEVPVKTETATEVAEEEETKEGEAA